MRKLVGSGVRSLSSKVDRSSKFASVEEAKRLWKATDAVCFDVDSTVIDGEGIDVLADFCGKGAEVAAWTRSAMGGSVPFHVALEERLKLFRPSIAQIDKCNSSGKLNLTPGIADLMKSLRKNKKHVYLVSGGFRQMIYPHAAHLNIPTSMIFANDLRFDEQGNFKDFNPEEPTSRAGGKAKVADMLKKKHGYKVLTFIGDGFTDLEARPPADLFIGFGGIAVRQSVKDNADWFVTDFGPLIEALESQVK